MILSQITNTINSVECFFNMLLTGPVKVINFILIGIIDLLTNFLPETPNEWKIGTLLSKIATENPTIWALSGEIFSLIGPMILIIIFVKAWKIFSPL